MTDINDIRNIVIEHSVSTESAVTDSIYETSEVLLFNIDQLRKEVRLTNESVERLGVTINNLIDKLKIENERENVRMLNEMEIEIGTFAELETKQVTKSVLKQKPEPTEDHMRLVLRIMVH